MVPVTALAVLQGENVDVKMLLACRGQPQNGFIEGNLFRVTGVRWKGINKSRPEPLL